MAVSGFIFYTHFWKWLILHIFWHNLFVEIFSCYWSHACAKVGNSVIYELSYIHWFGPMTIFFNGLPLEAILQKPLFHLDLLKFVCLYFFWRMILKGELSISYILNIALTACFSSLRKQNCHAFCCHQRNNQLALDLLLLLIPLEQVKFYLWVNIFFP